jgi:hypothetical protein
MFYGSTGESKIKIAMKFQIEAKDLSFFKPPSQKGVILFLIERELISMKLADGLEKMGFDAAILYSNSDRVILSLLDLPDDDEKNWNRYHDLMDSCIEKVNLTCEKSISKISLDFYMELKANSEKYYRK